MKPTFDVYVIVDPRPPGALERAHALIEAAPGRIAIQVRAKGDALEVHRAAALALKDACIEHRVPLFVSTFVALARELEIGVHLPESAPEIDAVRGTFEGPIGVSCHDAAGLLRRKDADFAVLGPIGEVPGKVALGWDAFEACARQSTLPIYALGGVTGPSDVLTARARGARGVAAMRALANEGAPARLTAWLSASSGTMPG